MQSKNNNNNNKETLDHEPPFNRAKTTSTWHRRPRVIVNVTSNSPSQDYAHSDDHSLLTYERPVSTFVRLRTHSASAMPAWALPPGRHIQSKPERSCGKRVLGPPPCETFLMLDKMQQQLQGQTTLAERRAR